MPTRPKTNRKRGAPLKKNEAIIKRLIAAARLGLPYGIVATRAGITRETLAQWRAQDADLDRQLDEARAEAAEAAWRKIMAAGESGAPGAWQSIAWRLERSHPESFARPEIQLGIAIQNNVNGGNGGHSFETVVVSDLEFLGLRQHENYSHRPHEKPARDVESTVMPIVPEDLSGTLVTQAHPGCSVVSQSQAEESARRVRKANTRIDELLAAKLNGSEPPSTEATVASSSLVPGPVRWPKDAVPSHVWWSQFVTGDADREVEKETAIKAVRHAARELLGEWKAQGISVDFDDNELVTVRTVVALVEELAGHAGWKMLLRLAGE